MPIQLRTITNKVVELPPETRFVELVDGSKAVACVVYEDDNGVIQVIKRGDSAFTRYVKLFKTVESRNSLELSE